MGWYPQRRLSSALSILTQADHIVGIVLPGKLFAWYFTGLRMSEVFLGSPRHEGCKTQTQRFYEVEIVD